MRKRIWRRAGFTVEASFLLPFLWFIIFTLVCLGLYLHDRSVLSASAAELAGKGAALKYQSSGELKEQLVKQGSDLVQGRLLSLQSVQVQAEVTERRITVRYTGKTGLLGGLEICEEETAERLEPVSFLRKSRQLGSVLEQLGEE